VTAEATLVKKFDHVGFAVRDVDSALRVYRDILGGKVTTYKQMGTEDEYTFTQFELGGQRFELIEPIEGIDSFLTRFIEKRGEGMHHLTFQVYSLKKAIEHFQSRGLRIVDEFVEDPAWKVAFISPRSSSGVLIQLYETYPGSPYDH